MARKKKSAVKNGARSNSTVIKMKNKGVVKKAGSAG